LANFNYGGQAVVEGVMMRGRHSVAVAVRRSSGDILVHEETLNPRLYANRLFQLPFLRGVLLLWDMLILGTRMLAFAASASQAPESARDTGPESRHPAPNSTQVAPDISPHGPGGEFVVRVAPGAVATAATHAPRIVQSGPQDVPSIGGPALAFTLLLSLAFAVVLFFLTPVALVNVAERWLGNGWLSLAAEGAVRLTILLAYLWVIGRMPGVRRVFEYHGAEHKAINTYEAGLPLDVEHVRAASKVHTRCGTGFLLLVMVVSIFVFALVGRPALPLLVLSRVLLIPVVASIAYELMRLGAANYRFRVVRWLLAPGLALQGLTTRQPDDRQIECAIVALDRVLREDRASGAPVRVA
jgi:uncharacterized protein YqhQ